MRAGVCTRGASNLVDAKIALSGLWNSGSASTILDKGAVLVTYIHHSYIVIWAGVCAGGAANTTLVINNNLAFSRGPVNSTGWTANHAYRICAMHAGISHHIVVVTWAVSIKARIIIVGICTRDNTLIATHAIVELSLIHI